MRAIDNQDNFELAIIGMSGRFPRAANLQQFWHNLQNEIECITCFSDQELMQRGVDPQLLSARNFVKAAPVLEDIDLFSASFFGYSPREAELMDPQHRILLECAWEAMEVAGYNADAFSGLIGVYTSTSLSTYLLFNLLANPSFIANQDHFQVMLGNDKDFLSTQISYSMNLRGPSLDVQTGCSSSLVALHLACESLLSFQTDIALVGGISVDVPQRTGYTYQPGGITSPDGHCRPFDAQAQGTIFGSGAGVVVLKRLNEALRDGDSIQAIIKGSAINNDGAAKVGYTAPSVEGQAEVITRAQALANVEAETISYIEAHGTGTALGDPIEVEALSKAFRLSTARKQFCALGSVKGNIGHLDAASGIAGLLKTVLALQHRQLPASLHYQHANPAIDFAASPFSVTTHLTPWPAGPTPRRAGVSSFGIGGTNAHVILQEAPPPVPSGPSRPYQVLLLSARSTPALEQITQALQEYLSTHAVPLADVAYTLQVGRKPFSQRRALVCEGTQDAVQALSTQRAERVWQREVEAKPRRIAFLFPGQGAQYVHMGQGLYEQEALFQEQVEHCLHLVAQPLREELRQGLFPSAHQEAQAHELLRQTRLAQPALFIIEYALAQLLLAWGIEPQAMIGHSVGEYVAACLAGVMTLPEALHLVVVRGDLMQRQPVGAMLAVELSEHAVQPLLANRHLALAAVNSPTSCVVAGSAQDVEGLEAVLSAQGSQWRRLETSHAFHSPMMEPVVEPFEQAVRQVRLQAPQRRYCSNVSGDWISEQQARDASYWGQHVCAPVRFSEAVATLLREGEWVFVEVGPGGGLSAQVRKQAGQAGITTLRSTYQGCKEQEHMLGALGQLWVQGVEADWSRFVQGEQRQRLPLPTYPFERQRFWIEPQGHSTSRISVSTSSTRENKTGTDLRANPAEWLYVPSWKRSLIANLSRNRKETHCWLVFSQGSALISRLIAHLRKEEQHVIEVEAGSSFIKLNDCKFRLNPSSQEDYDRLLQALSDLPRQISKVINAWPLEFELSPEEATGFEYTSSYGFYSMLNLTKAFNNEGYKEELCLWILTHNLYDISGVEHTNPLMAPMQAFSKVLPQEFSHIHCRCIDIAFLQGEEAAVSEQVECLWREMMSSSTESLAVYRHNQRWVQIFEPLQIANDEMSLSWRLGGVYLIVGGLGNIGFSLASHLAKNFQARLAIIGSTSLPPREEWVQILSRSDSDIKLVTKLRKIQALEELGSQVLYFCVDVIDKDALQASLAAIRTHFHELNGVIYAAGNAGVKTVKLVADITKAECELQFRTKVKGLYNLAYIVRDWTLDFCIVFSSTASILGGIGSIAYTSAHLFSDAFVLYQSKQSKTPWLTINWDNWSSAPETDMPFYGSLARYGLTSGEGIDALQLILGQVRDGQVVVSRGDLEQRSSFWSKLPQEEDMTPSTVSYARPELATIYTPPNSKLEERLIAIWQELLGIERIGIHDNFFDLGGNSLIGLNLIARLNETFSMDIPAVTLFEKPTISSLVKVIDPEQNRNDNAPYERVQKRAERRKERREQKGRI